MGHRTDGESAVSNIFSFLVAGFVFMGAVGSILYVSTKAGTDDEPVRFAGEEASAESLADLLVSSPGIGWASGADGIGRLGLMADNRSGIDISKMDTLQGAYEDADDNGKVDYAEAVESLGLEGSDFHIRVYPIDPSLGDVDLSTISTAYVGDWLTLNSVTVAITTKATMLNAAQASLDAQMNLLTYHERAVLASLGLDFTDDVYLEVDAPTTLVPNLLKPKMLNYLGLTLVEGDVYPDIKTYIDATLVDRLDQYDLLVVGGGVNQNAFTSSDMKAALRQFVTDGGTLIVFGNDGPSQAWLNDLLSVGVETVNGAAFAPDVTHPVLREPHALSWTSYDTFGRAWDIKSTGSGAHYEDFTHVIVQGDEDVLAISNAGTFEDGRIFLTSYRPNEIADDMGEEEAKNLLHNFIVYSDYNHLYLDYGATIPEDVSVSAAVRESHLWDDTLGQVPVRIEVHYWE